LGHKVNVSETDSASILMVLKRWFTLTMWHSCQTKISLNSVNAKASRHTLDTIHPKIMYRESKWHWN